MELTLDINKKWPKKVGVICASALAVGLAPFAHAQESLAASSLDQVVVTATRLPRTRLEANANINVVTCSRLWEFVDGTDGLRYHTSVPLYASHGKKLGVLNVADTDWRELSADDLRLLHTIGDLLSITIERARLFARSRQIGISEERGRLA